jgi:dTDP-4-dehydrorhamnose 3,5-epimerase
MKFIETPLSGAYVIELEPLRDERGLFARTFCQEEFGQIGLHKQIVQINHSVTRKKGAIRGMHYQRTPACETKLIRCIQGGVFDVMLDLRVDSTTFLHHYGVELSKDNMRMIYIPEGFAHGFQTLTDDAEIVYHHFAFYNPQYEHGLRYDDPALAINWPLPAGVVSLKDQNYPLIDDTFKGFET